MIDSPPSADRRGTTKSRAGRAVIDALKLNGPQTAQALAGMLGVTAMAIRQHLYDLAEQGLVSCAERHGGGGDDSRGRGRGRPAKIWSLTEGANGFFPDGHADLAVGLIHTVRAAFGEAGIDQLLAVRTDTQLKTYGKALGTARSIEDRLQALARVRTHEGYMADVESKEDGSFIFVERHCPICSAAQACTGLCASELQVFQHALGEDVSVERTDHILAGARRCAYRVRPRTKP